ncbi:SusD/RagB family nutrient-binding outer membrane lipoprotein [Pseudoflavitalea sp. G-6-1-2]|uniref:SusD/RagB family nutrient-binding outer membrane lipoprotein n=1 Tax=Pseudoflavitalea sp. G-6-1-2 TaxID=2728841 RepID=UPI00146B8C6F|nr:SusD/RagB family nutrient-binding outer membrane lipoprotein [Pseudoflavitalea sp. G-6-1-2]NML20074.1 SusD/RagB family nutrient-binding outer membrane lipoprotein [Pseudoflavitalea sp. G-6-1-2]
MPRLKIYHGILALGLMGGLTSCDKDFEEINTNPNASTEANANLLFSQSLLRGQYVQDRTYFYTSYLLAGNYVQHYSTTKDATQSGVGNKYGYDDRFHGAYFNTIYTNVLNNLTESINAAKKAGHVNKVSAARIYRVLLFQRLTDIYGDVPYKDALKGFPENNFVPAYDPQSEIYDNLLKELDEATAAFNPAAGNPTFGDADFLYKGNVDQWKKLGYSIMLRVAMRLTKRDEAKAKTWAQKAIAGGVIQNAVDNAVIKYPGSGQVFNNNPVAYEMIEQDYKSGSNGKDNTEAGKYSKTFIDYLKNETDPRLPVMAVTYSGSTADNNPALAKGLPNGIGPGAVPDPLPTYSEPNKATFLRFDAPFLLMTNSEMAFLLAEAALRNWTNGATAADYFKKGIENNMRNWALFGTAGTISETNINNYTTAHPLTGTTEEQMEKIHTQFWVALLTDEMECYANWRRTGYPKLTPTNAPGNVTGGVIPRRFVYLQSEVSNNKANYQAAVARQGEDNLLTRIWWDKQ